LVSKFKDSALDFWVTDFPSKELPPTFPQQGDGNGYYKVSFPLPSIPKVTGRTEILPSVRETHLPILAYTKDLRFGLSPHGRTTTEVSLFFSNKYHHSMLEIRQVLWVANTPTPEF